MPTFPLSWPAFVKISSSTFGLNFHQTEFGADFSGKVGMTEINEGKNDRWEGSFSIVNLSLSDAGKLLAFLTSLKAGQGTFLAFDPDRREPATLNGSFPGTGAVNGAGQTGRTLNSDGWAVSAVILKAGDLIQIENQLLEISSDVSSDGVGAATLSFQPALRLSPADGANILTSNPVLVARLKDRETFLPTNPTHSTENTIFFEEVL